MASIPFELKGKTIYVAGHRSMVGSALVRRLTAENVELLTVLRSEIICAIRHVIHAAHVHRAEKVMFLGSSCIYPKLAPQPLREDSMLTGPLEPTNESYAIAEIAGIKMVKAYRSQYGADFINVMPTNL
jgi:GDP-L-fucose synthase